MGYCDKSQDLACKGKSVKGDRTKWVQIRPSIATKITTPLGFADEVSPECSVGNLVRCSIFVANKKAQAGL